MTVRYSTTLRGHCDVYGCDDRPEFDIGKYVQVAGYPGLSRFLCHDHGRLGGGAIHKKCGRCQKDKA